MAEVYVRSTTGSPVTLSGVTISVVPQLIDDGTAAYTTGLANGQISVVDPATAQQLIEESQIPVPLGVLPSLGEVLLVGPSANISLAAGATYNSPSINLLGNRTMIGFQDVSGLGTSTAQSWIYVATTKLTNKQVYTYASSGSYQGFNPVLNNTNGGNSGIYTSDVYYSIEADASNTAALTINGISLGVA